MKADYHYDSFWLIFGQQIKRYSQQARGLGISSYSSHEYLLPGSLENRAACKQINALVGMAMACSCLVICVVKAAL